MDMPDGVSRITDSLSGILQFKLFELNQQPVTVASIVMFIVVVLVFFLASRVLNRVVLGRILKRLEIDKSTRYRMQRISHYIVVTTGAIVAFQFVGIDLGGLAVIFGLLSVGIGFGLQNITSNFISGIIMLFEQPIKVGDRVTVGDTEGDVVAINMRATTIKTLNSIAIIVPNSEFISGQVTNWSHGDPIIRLVIDVGVSYNSDLDTVVKALKEVAADHPNVLDRPEPSVLLRSFGDSSWNMQLRVWLPNPKHYYMASSEINCAIVHKFREYGVEIPFPQRDLHVRSPLPVPLSGVAANG